MSETAAPNTNKSHPLEAHYLKEYGFTPIAENLDLGIERNEITGEARPVEELQETIIEFGHDFDAIIQKHLAAGVANPDHPGPTAKEMDIVANAADRFLRINDKFMERHGVDENTRANKLDDISASLRKGFELMRNEKDLNSTLDEYLDISTPRLNLEDYSRANELIEVLHTKAFLRAKSTGSSDSEAQAAADEVGRELKAKLSAKLGAKGGSAIVAMTRPDTDNEPTEHGTNGVHARPADVSTRQSDLDDYSAQSVRDGRRLTNEDALRIRARGEQDLAARRQAEATTTADTPVESDEVTPEQYEAMSTQEKIVVVSRNLSEIKNLLTEGSLSFNGAVNELDATIAELERISNSGHPSEDLLIAYGEAMALREELLQTASSPEAETRRRHIPEDSSNGANLAAHFGLTGEVRTDARTIRDLTRRTGSRVRNAAERRRQQSGTRSNDTEEPTESSAGRRAQSGIAASFMDGYRSGLAGERKVHRRTPQANAASESSTPPAPTYADRSDVTPPPPHPGQERTGTLPPPTGEHARAWKPGEAIPSPQTAPAPQAEARQDTPPPPGPQPPRTIGEAVRRAGNERLSRYESEHPVKGFLLRRAVQGRGGQTPPSATDAIPMPPAPTADQAVRLDDDEERKKAGV